MRSMPRPLRRAARWLIASGGPGLVAPGSTLSPDLRPLSGSPAATLGSSPISDPFFDPAQTWAGAVAPAALGRGNIPWYAGWTVGW